jgi:hypothetical protein
MLSREEFPMFVGDEFKPGDSCSRSGIYMVTHAKPHIEPHEVTAITGDEFPQCYGCLEKVRYVLARPSAHLTEHPALCQEA